MVDKDKEAFLNKIVSGLTDLLPLPTTVMAIIKISKNPNSNLQDLVKLLDKDQAMVTRILRLANSSHYGFSKEIKTINHAVVCLGFKTIQNMALTVSVSPMFQQSLDSYLLEKEGLFKHSNAVAVGSRIIAQQQKYVDPDESYVMGLLHDVGKLILDQCAKEQFVDVINLVKKGNISFIEAEEQILGFNHGEIGAKVAEKWNLSSELVETIRFHHNPEQASENNKSVHMVHIANYLVEMMGIGIGYDGLNYDFNEKSLELIGLRNEDMEPLMVSIMNEL
ncbi:MAG: hypothetical protein A2Y40_01580 [Candidatus Margulisbacteria bacterium GWF2_35_9]|nr:MAG: hypothetical protein A2Y40_01580 [Candidatus Margulisbacteria bacterium GWF2_35_9]